jgi:hypothetical protein
MKVKTVPSMFLLISLSFRLYAGEDLTVYELLSTAGTKDHPLTMDVESSTANISVVSNSDDKIGFLKIININPFEKNNYSIRLNQILTLPVAFEKPEVDEPKVGDKKNADIVALRALEGCSSVTKIKKLFDGKVSEAIAVLKSKGNELYPMCDGYISSVISDSIIYIKFQTSPGLKTSIEVTYNGIGHTTVVETKPIEWVTHVGFTFAQNKNNKFYSKERAAAGDAPAFYEVSQQERRSNLDYGATVLFTYPMKTYKTIQFGPTAGLASDANTIAVVIGGSIIFNQNIVITLGLESKQFDDLNGMYKEGQNIGDKAIDSSSLNEKQFKVAPMISIGYKFK